MFYANNCFGCHRIEGLSDGRLAPDLTEAGRKFKLDYLWESIDEPIANLATSFMPKFKLPEDVFLKSRKGRNGDSVVGGSLTGAGVLRIRTTRPAAESTLGQIVRAVETSMASPGETERMVDRISRIFVPRVLVGACATLAGCLAAGMNETDALAGNLRAGDRVSLRIGNRHASCDDGSGGRSVVLPGTALWWR